MKPAETSHIAIRTAIPGPKSGDILRRLADAMPRALRPAFPVVVDHAHGSLLTDVDGNVFIDLTGGIGVLNVGHTNDLVSEALTAQVGRFLHTAVSRVPDENLVRLAERLNQRFPGGGPARTMFFNSGAEAVENAVKIARAYTKRRAILSFEGSFHGRTLLALTLTGKVRPYKPGMGPWAPEVYHAPYPYSYRCRLARPGEVHQCDERCFAQIEDTLTLEVPEEDLAAIIVEAVQGEGGFVVPPPTFLPWLRAFADRHGALLIVDEVQTGFGRTGTFFATEHAHIRPDLITVAKSIAGGLPLSAVIGRAEVMDAPGLAQIGGTFGGNPLATTAANAVLDVFERTDLLASANRQGAFLMDRLTQVRRHNRLIGDVRGLGAMVAIELVEDRETKKPATAATSNALKMMAQRGLLVLNAGVYGNVIRFLAPLDTPMEVLEEALTVFEAVLEEVVI